MKLTKIKSSNVKGIGYDAETSTLYVDFTRDMGAPSVYKYTGFPAEKYTEFLESASIGAFFAQEIRGQYKDQTAKLTPEDIEATFGGQLYEPELEVTEGGVA